MIPQDFKWNIILGSASPRRKELLTQLGLLFEVRVIPVNESFPQELLAHEVPIFLAEKKASVFLKPLTGELLITADTLVICDGEIIGKPVDNQEAEMMLLKLSDKSHEVVTGVHLRTVDKYLSFSETTVVHFSALTLAEISWYVTNFSVLDKAGAYGIQDWIGARAIARIEGSYTNVVGLPTARLYRELEGFF